MDYNEKLRLAKKALDSGSYDKETIEYIFPELKENEDERTKKSLIKSFTNQHPANFPTVDGFTREQILSWLEKQGGQKPTNKIEPKFRIGDFVKNTNYHGEPIYEIVHIDKECYICEYRGKENMGDKAVMHFSFDNPYLCFVQNPTWSEDDEEMIEGLNNCLDELDEVNGWCHTYVNDKDVRLEDIRNWLKSLKERVQPQPKQEWSEEDKMLLEKIISDYTVASKSFCGHQGKLDWLKSLKERMEGE